MAAHRKAEAVDGDLGRNDGPVPADVELVVGREDAAVEDLERRLEQRRPRALQDHRRLLREGRRQRPSRGPPGSGSSIDGPAQAEPETSASPPRPPPARGRTVALQPWSYASNRGSSSFLAYLGTVAGFLSKKVDLHTEKVPAMLAAWTRSPRPPGKSAIACARRVSAPASRWPRWRVRPA